MMRIWQMLPSLSAGDGVGNEALAIDGILKQAGYETGIYADYIAPNVPQGVAWHIDSLPEMKETDILIYHLSIGSRLNGMLESMRCRILFRYHNITPAAYFAGYNPAMEKKCREGLWQIRKLAKVPYRVLAASAFNREHLRSLGYRCQIDVLPVLIPVEEYRRKPDQAFLEKYQDQERFNLLFVGRICPNKKQEDLIRAFAYYQKQCNSRARLFLAGGYSGMELYRNELAEYTRLLGLNEEQVIFTGSIRFEEILACYRLADVFWCMSEHEGFCIPLVEAMLFGVPILARDTSAVADTLGRGGMLLKSRSPKEWAEQTELVRREDIRREILNGQQLQLEKYQYSTLKERLLRILEERE